MNITDIFKNFPIDQQLIHFRNINPKHHVKLYLSLKPKNQLCILDKLTMKEKKNIFKFLQKNDEATFYNN